MSYIFEEPMWRANKPHTILSSTSLLSRVVLAKSTMPCWIIAALNCTNEWPCVFNVSVTEFKMHFRIVISELLGMLFAVVSKPFAFFICFAGRHVHLPADGLLLG